MITLYLGLVGFMGLWTMMSMNPVKVSVGVLFTSCFVFSAMATNSGLAWFPIILLMLFMGGIIMMFMILSSILPNEKNMKMKNIIIVYASMAVLASFSPLSASSEMNASGTKTFLMSGVNFFVMMGIILFYFLASMSTLSSEQTPMRSLQCYQNLTL